MKNNSKYLLIAAGIALGLAGGVTIGVSEAEEIRSVKNMPQEFLMKVAGTDTQKPVIPMEEIIKRFEQDGNRISEIALDREFMRDIYELELIDANGVETDIDVDARTGEVLKQEVDY